MYFDVEYHIEVILCRGSKIDDDYIVSRYLNLDCAIFKSCVRYHSNCRLYFCIFS